MSIIALRPATKNFNLVVSTAFFFPLFIPECVVVCLVFFFLTFFIGKRARVRKDFANTKFTFRRLASTAFSVQ